MKKTLILLLACCACIRSQAQTPEAAAAPEPSVTRTDSTLTFPEPEFIGQALAIRPDNRTEQLVQESLAPRHRSSTGQKLFGIGKNHIDEMTLKGAFSYHYYENFYTLSYIDKMWGILRKEAFPASIEL